MIADVTNGCSHPLRSAYYWSCIWARFLRARYFLLLLLAGSNTFVCAALFPVPVANISSLSVGSTAIVLLYRVFIIIEHNSFKKFNVLKLLCNINLFCYVPMLKCLMFLDVEYIVIHTFLHFVRAFDSYRSCMIKCQCTVLCKT